MIQEGEHLLTDERQWDWIHSVMDLKEHWWVAPLATLALGWVPQGAGPGTTLLTEVMMGTWI